jgi:hypothetical protein
VWRRSRGSGSERGRGFGCLGQGRHLDRGDLVALAAQDLEAEAVEGEDLADVGDPPRLVQHQAGDGRGFLVGQTPVELPVQVADRHRALDDHRAVAQRPHAFALDVVFVGDLAHHLLQDVLQGDHAQHLAVFVDHDGEMFLALAEGLELGQQVGGLRNEPGVVGDLHDVEVLEVGLLGVDRAQQGLGVQHADDVVRVVAP